MGFMSTLEGIEAAVQQLPPATRAEFRAWVLSFDASDWDQQMENDMTAGKLDWFAKEEISESQAGRCSELSGIAPVGASGLVLLLFHWRSGFKADRCLELLKAEPRHPLLPFKRIVTFWSARDGLDFRALAIEDGSDGLMCVGLWSCRL